MTQPSRYRLEFAATIFVRECLRQYMRLHPGTPHADLPMKAFCDYPHREQQALMAAIAKAIEAGSGMDETYRQFLKEKLEPGQTDPA